jgi:hypothetical protein
MLSVLSSLLFCSLLSALCSLLDGLSGRIGLFCVLHSPLSVHLFSTLCFFPRCSLSLTLHSPLSALSVLLDGLSGRIGLFSVLCSLLFAFCSFDLHSVLSLLCSLLSAICSLFSTLCSLLSAVSLMGCQAALVYLLSL